METVVWSMPAMCMVPTPETARENKYVTTGGRIKFKVGQSGTITFVAPVTISLPQGRYTLLASLGRTTSSLLGTTIQLRRVHRATGHVETVLECVTVPTGGPINNVMFSYSSRSVEEVDLDNYYYWVQVTM